MADTMDLGLAVLAAARADILGVVGAIGASALAMAAAEVIDDEGFVALDFEAMRPAFRQFVQNLPNLDAMSADDLRQFKQRCDAMKGDAAYCRGLEGSEGDDLRDFLGTYAGFARARADLRARKLSVEGDRLDVMLREWRAGLPPSIRW